MNFPIYFEACCYLHAYLLVMIHVTVLVFKISSKNIFSCIRLYNALLRSNYYYILMIFPTHLLDQIELMLLYFPFDTNVNAKISRLLIDFAP